MQSSLPYIVTVVRSNRRDDYEKWQERCKNLFKGSVAAFNIRNSFVL
jgi:hypothetical protein